MALERAHGVNGSLRVHGKANPPPSGKPATSDQQEVLRLAVLALLATLPYLNTLFNAFVYDDVKQIVANPYVQSWRYLPQIFGSNVWSFLGSAGVTNHYRPLMTLTYLICHQFFGPLPFGFHLVNLILHGAVVCLLYRVTQRVFHDTGVAFVAAALFALHPIHTESVAWIAGITDLQLAFFFLLTFSIYLNTPPGQLGRLRSPAQWQLCAAFAMALLSKETAATLPLLLVFFEHFYHRDEEETPTLEKVRRYAGLWLLVAAYVLFRIGLLGAFAPQPRRGVLTWTETVLSALALFGQYVSKLVWPADLSAFYVFEKSTSLMEWAVRVGLLAALGTAAVFVYLWRQHRVLSFALLWVLIPLAPVLNARWMAANVFAERYLYLPSVGFCWLAGWLWKKGWDRAAARSRGWRVALAVLLGLVGALYATRVFTRNRDWRDDETLYGKTLARFPDAYLIRTNLGTVYWNRGRETEAVREWLRALRSQPEDVVLLNNLGLAAAKNGQLEEAEQLFRQAARIKPGYAEPYFNLGRAYDAVGRSVEAEDLFRQALAQAPLHTGARNHLAFLLLRQKRGAEAAAEFQQSVSALPNAPGYVGLGQSLAELGNLGESEQAYRRAIQLDSSEVRAHLGLAKLCLRDGRANEARKHLRAVLELDPANQEAATAIQKLPASPH